MNFFTAVVTSVLAASSLVFAAPTRRDVTTLTSSSQQNSTGAVYFMSNEGDLNRVVAASIGQDGSLNLDRAVSTGGIGSHGTVDTSIGLNALFSQASIIVSEEQEVLIAVNAGSNTISLFSIDASQPTNIELIGSPISSGGEFPVSVALSQDGSHLCALNGGAVNGINCFSVDKQNGLSSISNSLRSLNLNQTTPASGYFGTVGQVLFNQDESKLIASVRGLSATEPGFLAVWDISEDFVIAEEFEQIILPSGGFFPSSIELIPGTNAVLVTDIAVGFDIIDLSGGSSSIFNIDGQGAIAFSSLNSRTGNFFVTDVVNHVITEISIDQELVASIVEQYIFDEESILFDNDIIALEEQDFLFQISSDIQSIEVLSLDSVTNFNSIQSLDIATPLSNAGLTLTPGSLQGLAHFLIQ